MSEDQPLDYASAGVDIDRSDSVKQRIRNVVESTFTAGARGSFGGFGGMFRIPAGFQRPVLVSSADGVASIGTRSLSWKFTPYAPISARR